MDARPRVSIFPEFKCWQVCICCCMHVCYFHALVHLTLKCSNLFSAFSLSFIFRVGQMWKPLQKAKTVHIHSPSSWLWVTTMAIQHNFFFYVDTTSIPGGKTTVEAFDQLFKLHYIFNVQFAKPLTTFYNFFEGLVYVITQKNIRPTVRELYSQMMRAGSTDEEN